jgi:hypothetical protein
MPAPQPAATTAAEVSGARRKGQGEDEHAEEDDCARGNADAVAVIESGHTRLGSAKRSQAARSRCHLDVL